MTDTARRLAEVRARIDEAARIAGRDPNDVRLVAVSKTHPPERIREAYEAGQRDFGENYAQELRDKARALADLPGLRWHFIGRIQTNKAKIIAPVSFRVHAVSEVRHAEALAARASAPLPCLVAVNLADEASKGGVPESRALDVARAIHGVDGVEVVGLMTLPPAGAPAAPWFARLAALAARGRREGLALNELSMGMSSDFPQAIAHGATWVRVGTAIFGPRTP